MSNKKQLPTTVKDFDGKERNISAYRKSLHDYPSFARKEMGEDGETALSNCSYRTNPCGCRIKGCGTLQFPLSIEYCVTHKEAFQLFDTLVEISKCNRNEGLPVKTVIRMMNAIQSVTPFTDEQIINH
jgi:hypothetical protein